VTFRRGARSAATAEVVCDPCDEEELKIQQGRVDRALNDTSTIRSLSDSELREELLVAAMAPGDRRIDRYRRLLAEWHRRAADRAETSTQARRFARD